MGTNSLLIRGGSLVDGTGAAPVTADVRINNGLITELGADLAPLPEEQVFDAQGCLVTPGLIESHTHFDGTMWWQPDLEGCWRVFHNRRALQRMLHRTCIGPVDRPH